MANKLISQIGAGPVAALSLSDVFEVEQGTDPDNTSGHATLALLQALMLTSPENVQTGTSYTLVLTDAFKMVCMDNAAANTLTVPPNSSVAFAVGTRIDLSWDGAGQTTIMEDSGVNVRTSKTLKSGGQYGKATLVYRGSDVWDLEGNLEAAP